MTGDPHYARLYGAQVAEGAAACYDRPDRRDDP